MAAMTKQNDEKVRNQVVKGYIVASSSVTSNTGRRSHLVALVTRVSSALVTS
jgi:hypothetical protein